MKNFIILLYIIPSIAYGQLSISVEDVNGKKIDRFHVEIIGSQSKTIFNPIETNLMKNISCISDSIFNIQLSLNNKIIVYKGIAKENIVTSEKFFFEIDDSISPSCTQIILYRTSVSYIGSRKGNEDCAHFNILKI